MNEDLKCLREDIKELKKAFDGFQLKASVDIAKIKTQASLIAGVFSLLVTLALTFLRGV